MVVKEVELPIRLPNGAKQSLRCGFVPVRIPRTRPRLLLPCNWLSAEEADTEVDIGYPVPLAGDVSIHNSTPASENVHPFRASQ